MGGMAGREAERVELHRCAYFSELNCVGKLLTMTRRNFLRSSARCMISLVDSTSRAWCWLSESSSFWFWFFMAFSISVVVSRNHCAM